MEILSKKDIDELTASYPLYSQDGKKGDALALYHLFLGSTDWYVIEGSSQGDDVEFFGLVQMDDDVELGYFTLRELERLAVPVHDDTGATDFTAHVEKDQHFEPTPLKDLDGERVRVWLESMGYVDKQ